MSRHPQNTPAPRALSHAEAEELLSARLDAPIDPYDNRSLLTHLQGCQSCRAFAVQLEVMARDLEGLPRLPASPAVRREVHNRIQAPPPIWSRISAAGASGGLGRALPAALAAMVLLVALTTWVLVELTNSGGGGVGSNGGSISAPGDVAVLLTPTSDGSSSETSEVSLETFAPTPTARVVAPPTQPVINPAGSTELPTTTAAAGESEGPENAGLAQALPTATGESTSAAAAKTTPETPVTVVGETEAPKATTTPEVAIAAIAAASDATGTATAESLTATTEPTYTSTSVPPATATANPTFTPEPSATQEVPTAIPTATPSAPATLEPTATATSQPTETATIQPTQTSEPTSTATAEPTSTPTLEPTFTPTPEPTASATPDPTETPEPTATATSTAEPSATPSETPTPTATAEEEPQTEPTIAPRSGEESSVIQGQGAASNEVGPAVDTPASENGGSPPIAPSEGQQIEASNSPSPQTGEESAIATEESLGGQTGLFLDSAPVVADLGEGVTAPNGRLEFRPDLDYFCVTLADGSLGVASTSGSIVISLGAAMYPSWSPQGLVLLFADVSSGNSRVMTWDAEGGSVFSGGAGSDRAFIDTPAGWVDNRYFYQRTFPEFPGEIEFHSAAWDGSDDQVVWSSSGVYPVTARPAATGDGFLIATDSAWLFVSASGDSWEVSSNPYGSIGVILMSPGRTYMAYTAGSQIIVVATENPGLAIGAALPYTGGYDFASSGERIVVSNGNSLEIYSISGEYLGAASGSDQTGPPYWFDDTIYYLDIGGTTTLRYVSASELLAE